MFLPAVFLLVCSAPAFALVAGDPAANPADTPAQRVDPNVAASPWAGVGSLSVNGNTYSAVAISPRYVLTAAHVVSGAASSNIVFNVNQDGDLSSRITAAAIFVHPQYTGFRKDGVAFNDIALVRLASDLPPTTPTYELLSQPMDIGTIITLVGYGASGDGVHGVTVSGNPAVKRVGQNVIDLFLPAVKRFEFPKAYVFYFDSPDGRYNAKSGPSLGNCKETTLAGGDSGSPAFVNSNGRWLLAGINTFQMTLPQGAAPPRFGSAGGGMWVPAYKNWIKGIIGKMPEETGLKNGNVRLFGFAAPAGFRRRSG